MVRRRLDAKKIGKRLRKLRGEATQREIAEALGLSKMAISQYEQGVRVPADCIKIQLAKYFNKSVAELFFE